MRLRASAAREPRSFGPVPCSTARERRGGDNNFRIIFGKDGAFPSWRGPSAQESAWGGGSSSKASSRPTARKDKPRASLVACPCCGKEVPDKLINAHLDAGCPGSQPPSQQQPPQQVDVSQPNMSQQTAFSQPDASQQQPLSQQQAASQQQATMPAAAVTPASAGSLARRSCPPATASPKSHQGNALAALMVGARKAATRRERFHLSQDSGRWHCQWTAGTGVGEGEGVSEVAWSAVMVVKEAGMGELHLTLSTDVPSAPGSLAASGVLPADRPDGLPTALAKSVMQKAVRRCRPVGQIARAYYNATTKPGVFLEAIPFTHPHSDYPK